MKKMLLLVVILPFSIMAYADSVNTDYISNCDSKQYNRRMEIGNVALELRSNCSDEYVLELFVLSGSSVKMLSKLLYPYSFTLKPLKEIRSKNNHVAILQLLPSEPQPTGSYYFAVVDLISMSLILDAYSDSEINIYDIDNDGVEEIVYGINLSSVNPLDTLLDFIPYPKVLDWNRHGGLRLIGSDSYPQLVDAYKKSLSDYINQLSKKSGYSSGLMKVAVDKELAFAQAELAFAQAMRVGLEQFNTEKYLLEVKKCLNTDRTNSFDLMDIPGYLRKYVEQVEVDDYVSHTFLKPKELSIDFQKYQNGNYFSISLHIDLNRDEGCERISVYEIE